MHFHHFQLQTIHFWGTPISTAAKGQDHATGGHTEALEGTWPLDLNRLVIRYGHFMVNIGFKSRSFLMSNHGKPGFQMARFQPGRHSMEP